MKKVLAMSILTMIVMSMGSCGSSSDSSSSQDVSSKAETESNSPYTVEADFSTRIRWPGLWMRRCARWTGSAANG